MISRIIIPLLIIFVFTDLYIDRHILPQIAKKGRSLLICHILWLLQSLAMMGYSLSLALEKDFAPDDIRILNWFLLLLGVWAIPKLTFTICSILGWGHCVYHKTKTNWGNPIGVVIGIVIAIITVYGYTRGFSKLSVRHVTFVSSDVPEAFNGYRIVQFSDAHVGTYSKSMNHILSAAVDSMNAQQPDMIVFTGDLQNMKPQEIAAKSGILKRLHAKDGVFSILGNHDYAYYMDVDEKLRNEYCREVVKLQGDMGWTLLRNENRIIRRGNDSIVVAGMEYEGKNKRCPNHGNIRKTMKGVDQHNSFVLILQHDPTSWQTDILPHSNAQLTLSGHTHAAQIKLFGWSPAAMMYKQWGGMFYEGKRAINVSTGLGGFVPFRFWCPGEIVVIKIERLKN